MTVDVALEIIIVICSVWAVYATLYTKHTLNWDVFFAEMWLAILPTKDPSVQNTDRTIIKDPIFPKFSHTISWEDIGRNLEPNLGFSRDIQTNIQKKLQHNIVVGDGVVVRNIVECLSQKTLDFSLVMQEKTEELSKQIVAPNQRFIWIVTGAQWQPLVEFLHKYPGVRDYTRAVVAIHPVIHADWWKANFTQEQMDVEANMAIPYFFFMPPSVELQEPMASPTGWKSIDLIPCREGDGVYEANYLFLSKIIVLTLVKYQETV